MAFRDDNLAQRAHVDALEEQIERLRAENEALQRADTRAVAVRSKPVAWVFAAACALGVAAFVSGFLVSGYVGEQAGVALGALALLTLLLSMVLASVDRLLVVARPDEALVVMGRSHQADDGTTRGYRVVIGGRVMCLPLLETVERLDLAPFAVDFTLRDIFAREGRVNVHTRARLRISRASPQLHNAIERFLGRSPDESARVAEDVLEGVIRSVASSLTPAEMRASADLGRRIREQMEPDFDKLGFELESLDIVQVTPLDGRPSAQP